MRQYTLDGIELALKAIEHRKDCKTAAGIIRKMITTERMRKQKINLEPFSLNYVQKNKKGKQCGYMTATQVLKINDEVYDKADKKLHQIRLSFVRELMKRIGL